MANARDRTFGDFLRTYRQVAGLTQEELAARSSLSLRGISDLERGLVRRPRADTIRLLANALDLNSSDRICLQNAGRPRPAPPAESDDRPLGSGPGETDSSWRPNPPNNLPAAFSSFVGREREIADLTSCLRVRAGPRLVTLTGPGGCGKTRLAIRVAAEVLATYADGVWLVDLTPIADPALVPSAVGSILGTVESPSDRTIAILRDFLRVRRILLILDNCEHLVGAVAQLAEELLQGCPDLRILATSREALRLTGEMTWPVSSLTVPPSECSLSGEGLAAFESVRLFIDRAAAVAPGFKVTPENGGAVARVCRQLDGIPLAIELAAARLRLFDVDQIADRLGDRFRLLAGGSRMAPRRHQTLRALVDWSHDLLSPAERVIFRRLAVFAGGWTLEAAEAVCGGGERRTGYGPHPLPLPEGEGEQSPTLDARQPVASPDVLDLLAGLVDKSLVVSMSDPGRGRRHRLLETIRQYAEEKLIESGEMVEAHRRHRDWYLALSDAARLELNGQRHGQWIDRVADEHENVRSALGWCRTEDGGADSGLRIATNLAWYWVSSVRWGEGCQWLDEFLKIATRRDALRARALLAAGRLHRFRGDVRRARQHLVESLVICRETGDQPGARKANTALGLVDACEGDYRSACDRIEASLMAARATGKVEAIRDDTRDLGTVALAMGNDARARALLEESLTLSRRSGISGMAAMALMRLSILDRLEGDFERARARARESGGIFREQRVMTHHHPCSLGNLARAEGKFEEASVILTDLLRRGLDRGDRCLAVEQLRWLGVLAAARSDSLRGVTLIAAAATEDAYLGAIDTPDLRREVDRHLNQARADLGDEAFSRAWAEGKAMAWDDAVAYAQTV